MRIKRWYIGLAVISLVGCGGGGGGTDPNPPPSGNTPAPTGGITVSNNSFSPAAKTVAAGATVQWAWNSCTGGGGYEGETCVAHSVTFDDGTTSATQERGSYSRTFGAAGTYDYHCATHLAAMTGRVTVQ